MAGAHIGIHHAGNKVTVVSLASGIDTESQATCQRQRQHGVKGSSGHCYELFAQVDCQLRLHDEHHGLCGLPDCGVWVVIWPILNGEFALWVILQTLSVVAVGPEHQRFKPSSLLSFLPCRMEEEPFLELKQTRTNPSDRECHLLQSPS